MSATLAALSPEEEQLIRDRPTTSDAEDVLSFEDFYRKEYRAVVGLAFALSGSRWAAEDLAQDAFLAAHDRWKRISGYEQPGAWVRRVVANRSISSVRKRRSEAKALVRLAFGERPVLPEITADGAAFWDAVRSLPRRQAHVVALFYLEDRPVAEIAQILEIAQGTVKKHLFDGRRALARRLGLDEEDAR
jgi:RNA polymerase sigma-70 factor (ECF subfamily)